MARPLSMAYPLSSPIVRLHRRVLLAAGLVAWFASPAPASASAAPPPPAPVETAAVEVHGVAAVSAGVLELSCRELDGGPPSVECELDARFELTAIEDMSLAPLLSGGPSFAHSVRVGGTPLTGERRVSGGVAVQVEIVSSFTLSARERRTGSWLLSADRMRHLLLGNRRLPWEGAIARTRLLRGDALRARGVVTVRASLPPSVQAWVDGAALREGALSTAHAELEVVQSVPDPAEVVFDPGGPVLSLGARSPVRGDATTRFALRVGHEVALKSSFFASLSFETDFESIMESLVVEAASPMLLLLPGPFVGVGVVARQLGHRRADAALRLRAGLGLPAVAGVVDFDYWPAIREWSASFVARISL